MRRGDEDDDDADAGAGGSTGDERLMLVILRMMEAPGENSSAPETGHRGNRLDRNEGHAAAWRSCHSRSRQLFLRLAACPETPDENKHLTSGIGIGMA